MGPALMAAFDPATVRLLSEQLRDTNAQHKRDLNQRSKLPANSKSKMAQRLDSRISEAVRVTRDLQRLLDFMQGVNQLQPGQDEPTAADMRAIFGEPVEGRDFDVMPPAPEGGVR